MKSEQQVRAALELYADTIRRICMIHLKNYHDAEDVFQEVFLKFALREEAFDSDVHEKAWLVRVAINACKDVLKSFLRKKVFSIEDLTQEPVDMTEEGREVLEAVLQLPQKYRLVVYLFYFEGYSAVEIAKLMGRKENTIYTWLSRAKVQLKSSLGGEFLE